MNSDMEGLQEWVGKSQSFQGLVTAYQADAMAVTLDRDDPPLAEGDPIPLGWHQLFLRKVVKLSDTRHDGHPSSGDFRPPVPLPRSMWASTASTFHAPVRVGDIITKKTTIQAVAPKQGKSGQLVFVKMEHDISTPAGPAVTEIQDTVNLEEAKPGAPTPTPRPAPMDALWSRTIHPTPVMLFRFSALSMNSHRIHYDRTFVTEVEGHPGLVVQGALTQTLLLDLFRREMPEVTLKTFAVRAMSPLYDINDFTIQGALGEDGKSATLWALNHEGALAMQAEATF